mmetsp:Transcript_29885/g.48251  ORF Transcript_29885/g.48251 Transcript_29885/m.48251 type:complete len:99 (-) Transcript_29885:1980-2276(-)
MAPFKTAMECPKRGLGTADDEEEEGNCTKDVVSLIPYRQVEQVEPAKGYGQVQEPLQLHTPECWQGQEHGRHAVSYAEAFQYHEHAQVKLYGPVALPL